MPKRKPTDIVNLKVRFTEAMRARIEQEAKKNNRSLNGEIVYRLGVTFGPEGVALAGQFEEHEREMARKLREVVERLVAQSKAK
jgi:Arc-like DNA binding domain